MIAVWAVAAGCDRQRARASPSPTAARSAAGRAGLIASSFAEEAEADLFNEQAVVWGAVPELLIAGFETLVAGGVSPELAYLECVGELKLIADLIEARGIAGMREAISNTAELGALLGGTAHRRRRRARAHGRGAGGSPRRPLCRRAEAGRSRAAIRGSSKRARDNRADAARRNLPPPQARED